MVKHTQIIRRQQPTNYLSVFDHFVGLAIKGLKEILTALLSFQASRTRNHEAEAVTRKCSVKKVSLKVLQNSRKNFAKSAGLQLNLKRDSETGVFQ